MVFTKSHHYWEEGCPKVDEIDVTVVADDNTRIMQLQSGRHRYCNSDILIQQEIDEPKAVAWPEC